MCINVVKGLKNKMKNLLANSDQASDIKSIFEEIKLVRNITNIEIETQGMFKEVVRMMENQGNPKKDNLDLLNDLCNFAIQNISQLEFKNGIEDRIKLLNQTLKKLKIIQITFDDPAKFKVKVMDDIISEFNFSLDKISREGDVYVLKILEVN